MSTELPAETRAHAAEPARPEAEPAQTSSLFSARPGAVGSPPVHYGNPLGEQKALAAGAAVVDLSDRAVISVTGPDRLTWLDSLTSQSIAGLEPGASAETLLLDPTGHLEHAIRLIDDGVTAWLLVDGAEGGPLAAWLDRMRFMLRVEIADRSAEFATVGTLGSTAELPAVAPNGVPLIWHDPWRDVAPGGHQYAQPERHPAADWTYSEVLVSRADAAAVASLGLLPAAGTLALEALRIAAWRPRLSTEVDAKSIPHELDWLRSAVHLNKGCYRGQETVAKVHNLGHPPRRLVLLHLDGSEGVLPVAGDAVLRPAAGADATAAAGPGGSTAAPAESTAARTDSSADPAEPAAPATDPTEVGHVTSAAIHYELGPIALAVIKRTVDPTATLIVSSGGGGKASANPAGAGSDAASSGGASSAAGSSPGVSIAAAQEVIVPVDAGAEANVPRLPRLGAVTR